MNMLSWVLFGLIVGIVAGALDDTEGSILNYLLLGAGGALLGGMLANIIFGGGVAGFNATAFITASFCAVAILFAGRALRRV